MLVDNESNAVINQMDIFPTPQTPSGSFLNLSKLLSNTMSGEVNNDSTKLVAPMVKTVRSYRPKITERRLAAITGELRDGDKYDNTNDVSFVWNANLGRITAANFTQVKHVIASATTVSFLTNKPNYSRVNDINFEQLYFLTDNVPGLRARIRTFDKSGALLETNTEAIDVLDTGKMFRLNISPKALKDSMNLDFTNVYYYVVDIVGNLFAPRTEERVYLYEKLECGLDYVNLLWVNALGGIDSYQFVAPQDSISISRFQIKRNTLSINGDGEYSDVGDGHTFNASDVIINNAVTTQTRVTSKQLKGPEAYWLTELYASRQVFIELTDESFAPVLLNETNYQISKVKYNRTAPNLIQASFTHAQGIIPTGAHAYSTKNR